MHEEENPEAAAAILSESVSGKPHFYPTPLASEKLGTGPVGHSPNETWPQVIYIFDDGTVNCRRENSTNEQYGSADLRNRAFAVLRVTPKGIGTGPSIEVLKCRMGDLKPLFESAVAAHLNEPETETALTQKLFGEGAENE